MNGCDIKSHFQGNQLLPMMYVLMKKKKTTYYRTVFHKIRDWALNHGMVFAPPIFRIDSESGLIAAITVEFPGSRIAECLFHYANAIIE